MKRSEVRALIEGAGFVIEDFRQKKHLIFICRDARTGRKVSIVAPGTPSDWRAGKNFTSMLKYLAN
jgi:hypothetical protein